MIINNLALNNQYSDINRTIIIGNFDGVHLGHQSLIKQAVIIAKYHNNSLACITFSSHSQHILNLNATAQYNLFNEQDKYTQLFNNNIEEIFIVNDQSFFQLTAKSFVEDILVKQLLCHNLVVGKDFMFGLSRLGDIYLLLEYERLGYFKLFIVDTVNDQNNLKISSTNIRHQLANGDIDKANCLLGYKYYIESQVIVENTSPLSLGYYNVNIDNIYHPRYGVYIASVEYKKKSYNGVLNIGITPTFLVDKAKLEMFIFDFTENLYGEIVKIIPKKYLRAE
ncbi:riboflavin kinase [Candidatus Tisiphia endosymbiont of Oplodontha viridula]|uniref:riboflavin kinase n=1 Tax=Candidatus Tisiphia endosymbiont of Oplodontha viridula TaxID=3077925 RepID=UPI0035C8ADC2